MIPYGYENNGQGIVEQTLKDLGLDVYVIQGY